MGSHGYIYYITLYYIILYYILYIVLYIVYIYKYIMQLYSMIIYDPHCEDFCSRCWENVVFLEVAFAPARSLSFWGTHLTIHRPVCLVQHYSLLSARGDT